MMKYVYVVLFSLFMSSPLWAMERYAYFGWETPHKDASEHGILLASVKGGHVFRYHAQFNTDTLYFSLIRHTELFEVMASLKMEQDFAGLLPDYYQDGILIRNRGIKASYNEYAAGIKTSSLAPHYLSFSFLNRNWKFSNTNNTSPNLTLPHDFLEDGMVFSYTFWGLESDPSWYRDHIFYPAPRGLAFGYLSENSRRSRVGAWGALDATSFSKVDERNNPQKSSSKESIWIMNGMKFSELFALEWYGMIGVLSGGDDINRFRVGGLNPYVIPMGGVPWAGIITDRVSGGWANFDFKVNSIYSMGPRVEGLYVADIHREGNKDQSFLYSIGGYVRVRKDVLSADFRIAQANMPGVEVSLNAFYMGLGYQF